jgi:serine/threonine protein kinase
MLVYRCYDNRLRCTQRRPYVYEECKGIKEHCRVVLHIEDSTISGKSHEFGKLAPEAYTNDYERKPNIADPDWLWNYKGQLKVIQTPYHKGLHYAKCPSQLLPIVDFLEQMHNNNFVHGDIRAYNMVLNYKGDNNSEGYEVDYNTEGFEVDHNPKGWLIDFDFGGCLTEKEPPKYPIGYTKDLSDGFRLGKDGESITRDHDWYALGQIIFVKCYCLDLPDNVSVTDALQVLLFVDFPKKFEAMNAAQLQIGAATLLRDYLHTAATHGFELKLTASFLESLNDCHLLALNSSHDDSKGATGSPPKTKIN